MKEHDCLGDHFKKQIKSLESQLRAAKEELDKPCRQCEAELKKQGELLKQLSAADELAKAMKIEHVPEDNGCPLCLALAAYEKTRKII